MMLWALQALLFVLCIAGAGFFAASETALTSVSLSTWDRLRQERPRVSPAYQLWSGNPSLVMAGLLFGNMVTSLGASVLVGSLVRPVAEHFGLSTGFFILASSILAGSLILIVGEILPKLY